MAQRWAAGLVVGLVAAVVGACGAPGGGDAGDVPPPLEAATRDVAPDTPDAGPARDASPCDPPCGPAYACNGGICVARDAGADAAPGEGGDAPSPCDPPCPPFGYRCDPDGVCRAADAGVPDARPDVPGDVDCRDHDFDGHLPLWCGGDDCDDGNGMVHPGAPEVCNGIDDNCDGVADEGLSRAWYRDADGDGFGAAAARMDACAMPAGYVADGTDCNDADRAVYPGAPERCDGVDQNCDGNVDHETDLAAAVHAECLAIAERLGYGPLGGPAPPRCVFPGHPWTPAYAATARVICMACRPPDVPGGPPTCGCWSGTESLAGCP